MKTNLIILVISCLCFMYKAQTPNTAAGCFVIKANVGVFYDNDEKRYERGDPNYGHYGKYPSGISQIHYKQIQNKIPIFAGNELDYYFNRSNFFGMNIGLAYSFDKTYYTYKTSTAINNYTQFPQSFRREYNTITGSLNNHLIKLIFGLNFNTKFGLNVFIQPLNPELRVIRDGKSDVTIDVYEGYYKSQQTSQNYTPDSTSNFVSSYKQQQNIKFHNYATGVNFSLAFPSLIGVEQKFKIGKLNYVAGASAAFSALEWYAIYRVHFGICFGSFKAIPRQPGY